jgi:hypothetical protein
MSIIEPPYDSEEQAALGPQSFAPTGPKPNVLPTPDRPDSPEIYQALEIVVQDLRDNTEPFGIVKPSEDFQSVLVPLVGVSSWERAGVASRLQAQVDLVAPGIDVEVTAGRVTRRELDQLNAEVKTALAGMNSGAWGVGIDVTAEVIAVTIDIDESTSTVSALSAELWRRVEATPFFTDLVAQGRASNSLRPEVRVEELVRVTSGTLAGTQADQRQELPLYTSNWLTVDDFGACSAGFLMRRNNGDLRGTSASHCSDVGVGRVVETTSGIFAGTTVAKTGNPTNADALAFTVPGHPGWNFVQAFENGNGWIVSAEVIESQAGAWMCHSGRGLWRNEGVETSCGTLDKIDFAATDNDGLVHNNMDCTEDRTYGGDSGGAVWNWGDEGGIWAAGLVSVSVEESSWWSSTFFTCYHVMSDVRAALGYSLVLH